MSGITNPSVFYTMFFTLDQQKAHDPRRHISITANAGSGKTRVLVGRYCDLVEGAVPGVRALPDEIAAITFTEKAASELREKIAAEIERRLDSEEHRANWERLKRGRENFPSAMVTTIHGFCSTLLREFPIESDVPPNFAVIDGYERRVLADETLMDAIEAALEGHSEEEEEGAYAVARRIGREKMESILRMMLDKREAIWYSENFDGVLLLDRDTTLALWTKQLDAILRDLIINADTLPALNELIAAMKPEMADKANAALTALRLSRTAADALPRMLELQKILLTQSGTLRLANYPMKKDEIDYLDPECLVVAGAFKAAASFMDASTDFTLHETLYDDARVLLRIYHDAVNRYTQRKGRINALDFEDLQIKLLAALQDPTNRQELTQRFRYVMVDEFQDTNELQYALAREITDRLNGGKLCIVGDGKQSIYGFRNAEVQVFKEATEAIKLANRELDYGDYPLIFRDTEIPAESRDEALGEIKLAASFRLLPSLCAWVNAACAPLLKSGRFNFGVDYDPLVCARPSDGRGAVEVILAAPSRSGSDNGSNGSEHPDEANPYGDEEDEETLDDHLTEANIIARRIITLLAEERVWEDEAEPRCVRFSDIAILCRKRSFFTQVEDAFRRYAIPYVTWGGIGFYSTQEIFDLINYLKTLVNERDDVATLGILRSPYFAVSDAEIYRMSIDPELAKLNLWSRAVAWVGSGRAEPPLVRAVDIISDDRCMAGRISIALLLRRVVERTGWRGTTMGTDRGEQNLANIDKLLELARKFERRGFTSLFDFVEQLTDLIGSDRLEGEAAVNTGRDAVRLMTMHAAKGLEFPVVILPSLHSPPRKSGGLWFDKDLGFGWDWTFNGDEYKPAILSLMQLRGSERERSEETRLFYVAATRARDMLILSGEYDHAKPPTDTMLAWALAVHGDDIEIPEENTTLTLESPRLGFLEEDGRTEQEESWHQEVQLITRLPEVEPYNRSNNESLPFRAELVSIGELPANVEGEIYSATQYMTYTQCPTRYYLRYRLGVPEEIAEAYVIEKESHTQKGDSPQKYAAVAEATTEFVTSEQVAEQTSEQAIEQYPTEKHDTEDGTIFARLFRLAAARIDEAAEDRARTATIIEDVLRLEALTNDERSAMAIRLETTILRLLDTPEAAARLFPPDTTSRTDYELRTPVEKEYLYGVIDRVVWHADGSISFVQYKTRRITREELRHGAEGYRPQLRVYAWLLSQLSEEGRRLEGTILFTEHPNEPQTFTFSPFDMLRIEQELASAIADIRALSYSGRARFPTSTPHCPICPYYVEGKCLLDTTGT